MKKRKEIIILASGGIDSSALIDFYKRRKYHILCVHMQYGQASARAERKSVEMVCNHFNVKHTVVDFSFPMTVRGVELVFRNLLFILAACTQKSPPFRISVGIHSGTSYYDATHNFLSDCQRILDGFYGGSVTIEAPFIDAYKVDIIRYCKKNRVPIDLTYSCIAQDDVPCGVCLSCKEREKYLGGTTNSG